MAKAALLDVLRQTIGKYVKNLDPESLSVAVWSGKIELNSLELDVESINYMLDKKAEEAPNLAMPFKVLSGRFESLQVDVPWVNISSKPVVLRAQGLSVMVEPLDRSSSQFFGDEDAIEHETIRNMKRAAKQRELRDQLIEEKDSYRLQAYNLKKLALAAEDGGADDSDTSTFTSRIARRIMENIQIEISNVHVSLTNEDGAAGVVLESLKLMTTDNQGRFVYVDRTANVRGSSLSDMDMAFLHKILQIEGFGVYLDEDEFVSARKSLASISEDRLSVASHSSSVYANRSLGHSYVLAPLSFQARLKIADNSCVDNAKYELTSSLSVLSFLLTRSQVDIVRKVANIMSPSDVGPTPLFPEYRPLVLVKGNAREWWKYTGRCIGRMSGRRLWVEFFIAYKKRKKYIPLFKRHSHSAECPWVKPLNKEELQELASIEQDRTISIEGLMAWRSIADAQIDKEKEKKKSTEQATTSTSYFSYIFGSSTAATPDTDKPQDEEEPPIVLTVEEMKELEDLAKFDIADNGLAKDAMYYDLKFVLDAMKIDLVGYDSNHLTCLDMGKVAVKFDAKADGAFASSFDMYDFQVFDRITPNSIFPSVVKKIESGSQDKMTGALHLDVSMSSSGDQSLVVKMAGFQLVASKLLAQELQLFFEDSSTKPTSARPKSNPMLRKSLSGSVDLFYDAKQGDSIRSAEVPRQIEDENKGISSPEVSEILSNKLVDAWKKKSKEKVSWIVDVDIKAPIVLIPEACNVLEANVMAFDLGNLKLKYERRDPSALLQEWFDEYPRESLKEDKFETGLLNVSDLTFSVQKASFWHPAYQDVSVEGAVIDPIGVAIEFAVEDIGPDFEPRSCFIGVIPTISLKLSHVQASQILEVTNSWTDMLDDIGEDGYLQEDIVSFGSPSVRDNGIVPSEQSNRTPSKELVNTEGRDVDSGKEESCPMMYCRIGLQRLSVTIMDEGKKQVEAHLVSVYATFLQNSDESSVTRLTMGWFWILDWIESSYARHQRLLMHSNLPIPAESFAERNEYNVIEELTKEGVFERDYSGSTELADVCYKTFPRSSISLTPEEMKKHQISEECIKSNRIRSILDAKFRSLVVHWNPHAIKEVNALSTRFLEVLAADQTGEAGALVSTPIKTQLSSGVELSPKNSQREDIESSDWVLIIAEMESLGIVLNSARDDLPLFAFTISDTRLSVVPCTAGQEISLSLGDLKLATPENSGRTLPDYRTLLGMEEGRSGSLLTVKYCEGQEAIETLDIQLAEKENFEAVGIVELSPMRFCFIQSQVLTLVGYITDGILGALTAQAAITAAEAAKDFANSVAGHYYFSIRATSFEAIIPEAAYRSEQMRLKTASLDVDYYMYSDARGSDARVVLSNLMMKGNMKKELQESPINLSLDVKMPMVGIGSLDDQAMRVKAEISTARFILTKDQYSQIMSTLEKNLSETALFLREDDLSGQIITSANQTHSGVQLDLSTQRMYFILDIKEVSLVLNGRDKTDPLVRLTATETTISMDMLPDLEKSSITALLQDLICEDCRLVAQTRQSRFLIDRSEIVDDVGNKDIFQVKYCQEKDATDIDLTLGSPQLVLIPDLISEVLLFVGGTENNEQNPNQTSKMVGGQETTILQDQVVQVDSSKDEDEIETNLRSSNTFTTKISAKTGTCRIVLMDLGSQSKINDETKDDAEILNFRPELTETVVLQGIFSGSFSTESSVDLEKMLAANFQLNSDAMEIFTAFGREMKSPLQILEPASASVHGSLKTTVAGDTEIELRAAALTPVAFSLSIHNAALFMAIIDSVNDSLKYIEEKEAAEIEEKPLVLTPQEQERIEKLATALEKIEHSESFTYSESGTSFADSRVSLNQTLSEVELPTTTKIQIKMTMPKATISFINDLQGMDEALFRISVTNFVAGANFTSPTTLFDFHCNTSILADYFDSSVNLWSRLLLKPWEITMKGGRAPTRRFKSKRLSSTFDLESFPCWISFSEQFLVSLASAARMWSMYSAASSGSLDESLHGKNANNRTRTSARNIDLITSLPNAVSNHSGVDVLFSLESGSIKDRACPTECTQYFRFDPPKGKGYGGTRVYGQDVKIPKVVKINAERTTIFVNMDLQLGLPACAHEIGNGNVLYTRVVKEGKTKVLHLRSHVEILNRTLIPFNIEFCHNGETTDVGKCEAKNSQRASTNVSTTDGILSETTSNFSIPVPILANFENEWQKYGQGTITLRLIPLSSESDKLGKPVELVGEVSTVVSLQEMKRAPYGRIRSKVEVTCHKKDPAERGVYPLTLNVMFTMQLLAGGHVVIDVSLEPRSIIENKMPLAMKIRTLMPQTFSTCRKETNPEDKETTYCLNPNERVEIFTPGPSIAVTTRTQDNPIAGLNLGWLDGGWVDLPLMQEFSLQDPIVSMLPLDVNKSAAFRGETTRAPGAEFFIVEGKERLGTIADIDAQKPKTETPNPPFQPRMMGSKRQNVSDGPSSFILTVRNYGVDHTGSILFEQGSTNEGMSPPWQSNRSLRTSESQGGRRSSFDEFSENRSSSLRKSSAAFRGQAPLPLGAFSSPVHRRRISLLPNAQCAIRLLQMTMEGTEGFRRTMPFMIEQLPIGDGGAATVPIVWENKKKSGLFAYRHLVNEYQSEIHIVPEFIVYNGSENIILVKEKTMPEIIVEAGDVGQLRAMARPNGLKLSINFIELGCQTAPLSVGKLGLKVAIVEKDGVPIGSVYVQTVIDTCGDSRLVVKVGEVRFGSHVSSAIKEKGLFDDDFCRFRIRWTELQVVLNEAGQKRNETWDMKAIKDLQNSAPAVDTNMLPTAKVSSRTSTRNLFNKQDLQNQAEARKVQMMKQPVMAMIFSRFTVDFQRVFKDRENNRRISSDGASLQRSQISIIVHNIQIKDLTPNSHYPMVFDCNSDRSVFDLCIRLRGSLSADLLKVDLFDLNLAHQNGNSDKMALTTSEEYVWRILDLVNRILAASGEVSGFTLKYENDENDNYVLKIEDAGKSQINLSGKNQYTAPSVDTLYDVALARVSPFTIVVSFRRSPELARYDKVQDAPGAALTNYFTRKLKFTIDKAELNFSRYENRTLKGPMDRLIEALSTEYVSRMKFKVVSLLSAASVQDWRFLAAREDGDDEYVEGDILRATGNLAGKSAGLVVKTVSNGVGGAVAGVSSFVGDGIENGTSKIGARRFGSGVSSVVHGMGHGVGDTVSGVGTGAGKIIQGAGQGVGHVFGGISGGALQIGKGVGKGIATGDGRAVVEGIGKGVASLGSGIAQGAESAVMGTADGLLSAGKGIFSGFKSVGHGIGGAVRGKKSSHFERRKSKAEENKKNPQN